MRCKAPDTTQCEHCEWRATPQRAGYGRQKSQLFMGGYLVLFDTNILVDALKGIPEARQELDYYANPAVSVVSWMELIAGVPLLDQLCAHAFLVNLRFEVIHTNDAIMHEAAAVRGASIRRPPKMALPDAIIRATGNVTQRLLITRNKKDFTGPNIRIPDELDTQTIVHVINVVPPPAP